MVMYNERTRPVYALNGKDYNGYFPRIPSFEKDGMSEKEKSRYRVLEDAIKSNKLYSENNCRFEDIKLYKVPMTPKQRWWEIGVLVFYLFFSVFSSDVFRVQKERLAEIKEKMFVIACVPFEEQPLPQKSLRV